jgi:hypothetical protein
MEITAKVPREDPGLVKVLAEAGLKARLVRGGVIVQLKKLDEHRDTDKGKIVETYEIPSLLQQETNTVYLIDCEEHGGGLTRTGSATIVCGVNGERMRPYYIPKGYANSTHAQFALRACVTASASKDDQVITLWSHKVSKEGATVSLISERFWKGILGELPELYEKFRPAAEAALKKACCYHCRGPHYIQE